MQDHSLRPSTVPYALTIFIGAFLLFQVQPILGKFMLPWFGGGPTVWTACMLFFQLVLLCGYTYSHLVVRYLSPGKQAVLHMLLLFVALAFLPIIPDTDWKPVGAEIPVFRILVLLGITVGPAYLLLSSTGPLLQRWFSWHSAGTSPYRLYALSNLGSMLGLLTYPLVLEPLYGLQFQAWLWSTCFVVFVLSSGWCALGMFRTRAAAGHAPSPSPALEPGPVATRSTLQEKLLWLGLSACGSLLLLATTNQMTQDIAPTPFLWVLPLLLYLLSFIITFDNARWYDRRIWVPLFGICLMAAAGVLLYSLRVHLLLQIATYALTLFAGCMILHGELVRLKPDPRQLTGFYLFIAGGGALGGLSVSLVAPTVFDDYWEYHLGLLATVLLFGCCLFRDSSTPLHRGRRPWAWAIAISGIVALAAYVGSGLKADYSNAILTQRNFYGVLGVYESGVGTSDWHRELWHGNVKHGEQVLSNARRREPTSYFSRMGGLNVAIKYYSLIQDNRDPGGVPPLHMGAVGLGVGTMAAYGKSGDHIRMYEINPDVIDIAHEYFTFLEDSPAAIDIILGDARLSLEAELDQGGPQGFDILVLDAFNSDSIPVHLLTREAFDLYWQHMQPGGVIAVHISAVHLDLAPVIRGLTSNSGKAALRIINYGQREAHSGWSDWILVSDNPEFINNLQVQLRVTPPSAELPPEIEWTDDYSNLLQILK
jgi:hypothetical protein